MVDATGYRKTNIRTNFVRFSEFIFVHSQFRFECIVFVNRLYRMAPTPLIISFGAAHKALIAESVYKLYETMHNMETYDTVQSALEEVLRKYLFLYLHLFQVGCAGFITSYRGRCEGDT